MNDAGEQFAFEMLVRDAGQERSAMPYVTALRRLGIDASIRLANSPGIWMLCLNDWLTTPKVGRSWSRKSAMQ